MKIKKAVIPVAGYGTRFLPFTKTVPKEMLPIVNRPVIEILVEEIVEAGIKEILFITARDKGEIEDHFDHKHEIYKKLEEASDKKALSHLKKTADSADIFFIRQKEAKGLGHAVLKAKNFVKDEPFCLVLGDELVYNEEKSALKQVCEIYERFEKPVLGVGRVLKKDISKYGCIDCEQIEENLFKVKGVEEKPDAQKAKSDIAVLGRYVLTPDIFELIEKTKPGKNKEIQITDAIDKIAREKEMNARLIQGERYDTGNVSGYLKAQVEYSLRDPLYGEEFEEYLKELMKKTGR